MSLGTSIIAAIIGYFVLLVVGVNLIGIVIDGFVQPDSRSPGAPENISDSKSVGVTLIFCIITLAYLFALYNFWNIGIVASALLLMISRIPDLVFESKTGQKINSRLTKKGPVETFCFVVGWLALPILWYSLFFLQSRVTL